MRRRASPRVTRSTAPRERNATTRSPERAIPMARAPRRTAAAAAMARRSAPARAAVATRCPVLHAAAAGGAVEQEIEHDRYHSLDFVRRAGIAGAGGLGTAGLSVTGCGSRSAGQGPGLVATRGEAR